MRLSAKSPLATAAVIGTMMLGIGITAAVFSVVNGVLLKPLPFDESDRVMEIGVVDRRGDYTGAMAYPDVKDYKQLAHSFSDFTATSRNGVTLTEGETPQFLQTAYVDDAYARVFGIRPVLGRFFSDAEFVPGSGHVVMLSHAFWQRQFGGDREIIGRSISIDNEPQIVIGVLPPMPYENPVAKLDLIAPLIPRAGTYQTNRGAEWLFTAGKIKRGVTLDQVQRELSAVAADLARRFPDANGGLGIRVTPLKDRVVGDVRPLLVLLSGSVAAVLLITCVNIANILLGQSYARAREFAVRAALGDASGRIRRQLLTESMLCAGLGGTLGMTIAPFLTRMLVTLYPGDLPRGGEIGVDIRVLLVATVVTGLAGLLAGIPMARRASATDLSRALHEGGRSGSTPAQRRIGRGLITTQIAMSLALIFAAGVLLRTFQTLSRLNLGFNAAQLTVFQFIPSGARYKTEPQIAGFFENARRALHDIPAVDDVAMADETPIGGNSESDTFVAKERGDQGNGNPQARIASVDPRLFSVLSARIVSGRGFGTTDGAGTAHVVVINDALARRIYSGENPVGQVITWAREDWQIVGVVSSMRMRGPTEPADPEVYFSAAQRPSRYMYLFVKSSAPPAILIPQLRAALHGVDAGVAMIGTTTMKERVSGAIASQRFRAALLGSLGVLALFLSTIGIYGVVSQAVGQQRRDIGIRMALGEGRYRVQRRVVFSALSTATIGVAIGAALALGMSRWLSAFVVGVSPRDPSMLAGSGLLLLGVAVAAAWFPARRASRVDPLVALRSD